MPAPPLPPSSSSSVVDVPRMPSAPSFGYELPKRCPSCNHRYPNDFLVCPRDATPLTTDGERKADPFVGRVLGDTYQVIRLVGEGGMGRVYEARHLRLKERRFAVKVLHEEFASKPDIVTRFQREAESASAIDHPHVITVFDVHRTVDGVPYLVGEFLDGEQLGAWISRVGKLDAPTAVAIVRQVCRALAAAHAQGIVHRDMKPENVFVTVQDGAPHIKVLDFGISKAAGEHTNHLTRTGMIMGTPSYMAPEQARGEKVDHRTDIYAVGAVLYHALTGRPPFDENDAGATITKVITEEPTRPRSLESSVPEALEVVIQKAMAKDPRDRYQTMGELDAALAQFDVTATGAAPELPLPRKVTVLTEGQQHGKDATARTVSLRGRVGTDVVAGLAAATGSYDASMAKRVRFARPAIVIMTLGLTLWMIGGFVAGVGGAVRYLRVGELTRAETYLVVAGTVLAAITPFVLFVGHVRKVWPNSVKAMELASDLGRTASAAFVTYGVAAIASRVAATIFLRNSEILSNGLWDAAYFLLSVTVAAIAGGLGLAARFLVRRANR